MSTQKRYPRLSIVAFLAAALCGVLGFVQAEGFFVLSAFLALVGVIRRRGVDEKLDTFRTESALSFGYRAQFRRSPRNR